MYKDLLWKKAIEKNENVLKFVVQEFQESNNSLKKYKIVVPFLVSASFSFSFIFAVFWDSFLIKVQQDNCVDGLDCFEFGEHINLHQDPLNCSTFEESDYLNETISIFCYKFTLDIAQGIADAGGAVTSVGIELLLLVVMTSLVIKKFKLKTFCYHRIFVSFFIVLLLILLLGPITVSLLLYNNKTFVVSDITKPIQQIILILQICSAGFIPCFYFINMTKKLSST